MNHSGSSRSQLICLLIVMSALSTSRAEEVGERWGTEERERDYYPIVNIPLPKDMVIEAGAFAVLPDRRVAVGTRHGEIYLIDGVDEARPNPSFHRFATGLDEIFGLAWDDGAFRVTQSCELTRVSDSNGDGVADRFETISDDWGYANYHEYAFGSKLDADGPQFIAKDFKHFIRLCGMKHVRTSPYYPQSNGRIERYHRTIKSDCIRPLAPLCREDAKRGVEKYVIEYNTIRLHSAIGYVTPLDMLEGRQQPILYPVVAEDRALPGGNSSAATMPLTEFLSGQF